MSQMNDLLKTKFDIYGFPYVGTSKYYAESKEIVLQRNKDQVITEGSIKDKIKGAVEKLMELVEKILNHIKSTLTKIGVLKEKKVFTAEELKAMGIAVADVKRTDVKHTKFKFDGFEPDAGNPDKFKLKGELKIKERFEWNKVYSKLIDIIHDGENGKAYDAMYISDFPSNSYTSLSELSNILNKFETLATNTREKAKKLYSVETDTYKDDSPETELAVSAYTHVLFRIGTIINSISSDITFNTSLKTESTNISDDIYDYSEYDDYVESVAGDVVSVGGEIVKAAAYVAGMYVVICAVLIGSIVVTAKVMEKNLQKLRTLSKDLLSLLIKMNDVNIDISKFTVKTVNIHTDEKLYRTLNKKYFNFPTDEHDPRLEDHVSIYDYEIVVLYYDEKMVKIVGLDQENSNINIGKHREKVINITTLSSDPDINFLIEMAFMRDPTENDKTFVKNMKKKYSDKLKEFQKEQKTKGVATEFSIGNMAPIVQPLVQPLQKTLPVLEAADIPDDFKPIIELLNKKGYETKYSSPGYEGETIKNDRNKDGVLNGKLYTSARITFAKEYDFKAPELWVKTNKDDKTFLNVDQKSFDYSKPSTDAEFSKWKEKYLSSLISWVHELPDLTKKKKEDINISEAFSSIYNEFVTYLR